jgi:hypothetical protein
MTMNPEHESPAHPNAPSVRRVLTTGGIVVFVAIAT